MKKLFAVLLILILSFGFKAKADEGMWLLPLIEKLNLGKMTELGLKLSAEDIYSINKVFYIIKTLFSKISICN